jgi:hypothetical protein
LGGHILVRELDADGVVEPPGASASPSARPGTCTRRCGRFSKRGLRSWKPFP